MSLIVPSELQPIIDEIDASAGPVSDGLDQRLAATIPADRELTAAERKGAFAECSAWRFQRAEFNGRNTWDIYWAELASWVTKDGRQVYSPDIADVDEEIVSHWIRRSEASENPVVRARFADLAWEIGRYHKISGVSSDLARRAIDAYLRSASDRLFNDEFDLWSWLDRALDLAGVIKDEERFLVARQQAFSTFRALSAAGSATSHSHWRFDDILWKHRFCPLQDAERSEIIEVLERELQRRSTPDGDTFDPHAATDIADRLQRWHANESGRARQFALTAGQAFEAAARKAGGLVAVAWLEDLLPRYRNLGLTADAARVERTIRERASDAKGEMHVSSVEVEIPADEMATWADNVAGNSASESFRGIAAAGLMREGSTRKSVEVMLSKSPLVSMMPMALSGPGGFTEARVGSMDDDLEGRTVMHAGQLFNWQSMFLDQAFRRARQKHQFSALEVIDHLRPCSLFAEERLPLVLKGVEAWMADDFVSQLHILVPQIEAALRDCLAALGGPVLRSNSYGGFYVMTLGEVLRAPIFQAKFPPDFRFHLCALYTDPRGLNLRNHLAHGLTHPATFNRGIGNLVMHSVLLIAMLRANKEGDSGSGEVPAASASN